MNRVALFNKLFTKLGKKNWLLSLAVYDLVNEVNLYNRKDLQTISSMNFYQNTSEVIKKLDYACLNSVNRINEIQKHASNENISPKLANLRTKNFLLQKKKIQNSGKMM